MVRAAVACALAAAALAGCGGGDGGGGTPSGAGVSPQRAAAEAGATKTGLDRALERYREGDRGGAADTISATRGEHFALVEARLRETDAALASRLHRAMSTTLPRLVDDGVTVSQLAERLAGVEADLDSAVIKLRAP